MLKTNIKFSIIRKTFLVYIVQSQIWHRVFPWNTADKSRTILFRNLMPTLTVPLTWRDMMDRSTKEEQLRQSFDSLLEERVISSSETLNNGPTAMKSAACRIMQQRYPVHGLKMHDYITRSQVTPFADLTSFWFAASNFNFMFPRQW